MKQDKEHFSKKEAQQRFDAALRGARITGHKPMSEVSPKKKAKASPKSRPKR